MPHEVVVALVIRDNKILLGKRSADREFYPDVWDVFGGHVELGEGLEGALFRELEEELGITPAQWSFLETFTVPLPTQPPDTLTAHFYLVSAWSGSPVNRQPEEHSEIGWFSLGETAGLALADPVYPALFARFLGPE
jgi:8-oxo-dGTP diphosphatase